MWDNTQDLHFSHHRYKFLSIIYFLTLQPNYLRETLSRTFWGTKQPLFLKALLEALHASPHPASLFLLKLGTCRPNKAMAHQAACFGLCFHTSELAVPTGCWKRAKENYLACHISSLATASQEEGLKLNGNGNKIQPSDQPCWVSPTTTLPTQAATGLPGRRKSAMKPVALTAGNSADFLSFKKLYSSLSIEGASGISDVSQHPSSQSQRCFFAIAGQSMTFRPLDVSIILAPDRVLRSELDLILDQRRPCSFSHY